MEMQREFRHTLPLQLLNDAALEFLSLLLLCLLQDGRDIRLLHTTGSLSHNTDRRQSSLFHLATDGEKGYCRSMSEGESASHITDSQL